MILTRKGIIIAGGNTWEGIAPAIKLVSWAMIEKANPKTRWDAIDSSNCSRGTFSESLVVDSIDAMGNVLLIDTTESQNALNPDLDIVETTRLFTYAKGWN